MTEKKESMNRPSNNSKRQDLIANDTINYSDIPETDETFWAQGEIHLPRRKQLITLRLDPEVLEYFKSSGKGYQTKINAILKSYVEHHPKGNNL